MPALHLVDSLYAWFMAAICFWIQIWAAIIFRSAGVLLVGLVSTFRVSREQAAWPFEICSSITLAQGAGVGIMVPTNVVVLNRYFDVYRTSASGLSFAGGALSSILLPPLIGRLLDTYGLQGTVLIVGALVLNAMAGSVALRSSPSFPRPPHQHVFSTTDTRCSSSENSQNKNPVSDLLVWDSGIVLSALPSCSSEPRRRRHRGVRCRT
ncbi:monocarboxylate transporter 9-like [Rhipicephalus sanguineus]|uniref:monocarboxylate transporter 9-like n=1 Tax=Rhipicephalus sanguineus TaxID=34632 RepID=UPI0020C5B1FD|nr:monocarboxylate transporter 9-like [Rhipicephalus sanguineus]